MKKVYIQLTASLIVFFLLSQSSYGLPNPIWHPGQLILWDKTTLEGDISYNWSAEMVLLRQSNGRLCTFSAHQINQFGWFDYSTHKHRNFVALPDNRSKQATRQTFFEICTDGPLSVVRRLRRPHGLLRKVFSNPSYYTDQPQMAQNQEHFDYYVYDAGKLRSLDKFFVEIYEPLMTSYDQELREYVLKHNLNDRSLLGRLVLIDRYNQLVQQDPRTASARETRTRQD